MALLLECVRACVRVTCPFVVCVRTRVQAGVSRTNAIKEPVQSNLSDRNHSTQFLSHSIRHSLTLNFGSHEQHSVKKEDWEG